jgi:hypothetical protein
MVTTAAVREIGKLKKRAGMAVVGSWTAKLPDGGSERLALLTSGQVREGARSRAAKPSLRGRGVGRQARSAACLRGEARSEAVEAGGDEARQERELEFPRTA